MKKIYLLFCFVLFTLHVSFGQTGRWVWISGSSATNATAVYGTKGTPSVNNHPPAVYDALEWKDKNGNFWIYGGTYTLNTNLWKFNPTTLEWTWMTGSGAVTDTFPVGTKGTAVASNTPGQRSYTAQTWVDTSGALWLMGGAGSADDMWKYNTGTNMWTWVDGTKTQSKSIHGTMGTAAAANTPGNRYSGAATWTDSNNNLWMFGGWGAQDDGSLGAFTDLWKYNIASGNWTWMKGSKFINAAGVYGTKGVAAAANIPGGRFIYSRWKDTSGNFWIMGGLDWGNFAVRNDLWKYDNASGNWAWMSGPNALNDAGTYTTPCTFTSTGVPDSREYNRSVATDNGNGLWMFGGFGSTGDLNDLWVFDPATLKWNLAKGPNSVQASNYGTKGVSAASNMPPGRGGAVAWWGNNNKFYMFGGGQGGGSSPLFGDMWMYDPDTTCTPTANRSLPIELLSFDAIYKEGNVQTTWSTASETNNDFFTVEKAYDIKHGELQFTPVGTVKGAGNSTSILRYQFTDNAPFSSGRIGDAPFIYYRLKQTDFDGQYSYSDVVAVRVTDTEAGFTLFPNPANNEISVYFSSINEQTTISVINALGQEVLPSVTSPWKTEHTSIDISLLPPGVYFLQLKSTSGAKTKKFAKE